MDPNSASPSANLARLLRNRDAHSPSENGNHSLQSWVESERLVRAALEERPDDPVRLKGLHSIFLSLFPVSVRTGSRTFQ